jgi:hypothetical protein
MKVINSLNGGGVSGIIPIGQIKIPPGDVFYPYV